MGNLWACNRCCSCKWQCESVLPLRNNSSCLLPSQNPALPGQRGRAHYSAPPAGPVDIISACVKVDHYDGVTRVFIPHTFDMLSDYYRTSNITLSLFQQDRWKTDLYQSLIIVVLNSPWETGPHIAVEMHSGKMGPNGPWAAVNAGREPGAGRRGSRRGVMESSRY
jgi:hypothetical protein